MTTQNEPIKNPIKEFREALGLSQAELAHYCWCSPATISNWERNGIPKNGISVERMLRLCQFTHLKPEDFPTNDKAPTGFSL